MMRSDEEWLMSRSPPQRYVFQRRHGVAADGAGQAADALGQLRIAFVWHRRRAGLTGAEGFFYLMHFGALHSPNLGGELFQPKRQPEPWWL